MRHHLTIVAVPVLLAAAGSWLFLSPASAASHRSAGDGGSATYQCQGDYDTAASPTPVTFALLSQPASVGRGDALTLSGTLSMTLSDGDARTSQAMLSQNANIDATDFTLIVSAGGKDIELKPDLVVSRPRPITTPFVLDADVSYPELALPRSATGSVEVTMPYAKRTRTEVAGAPAKVTFTARLEQDSPVATSRDFACWADKPGSRATIARIPVSDPSDATPASSSGTPAAAPASDDSAGTPPGAAPAPPAGGVGAAGAPGDAPAATSPVEEAGTPPLLDASPANAPIPPGTVSDETFIPGWILALFVAVFPAAAVAYAVAQRRRLRGLHTAAASR